MRKKVSSDRLAEAQKEGAARLAQWRAKNPLAFKARTERWLAAVAESNAARARQAAENRRVWQERAVAACSGLQFGDAIVYRQRVVMCLGASTYLSSSGPKPCTLFRFWCIDCGVASDWSIGGGSETLPRPVSASRTLRTPARCRDCGAAVRHLSPNAIFKLTPLGYSDRALANMSAADREFVCRAVAEQEDID